MARWILSLIALSLTGVAIADSSEDAAARGKRALESQSFNPAVWTVSAYESLWKQWGLKEKPADFDRAVREHYGLHPAPFPNDGLPMGLRKGSGLVSNGISVDCMVCHGGSIMGKSYIGLGNSALDVQALFEDLNKAMGRSGRLPFCFSNVRGTSEAVGMSVFLLGLRDSDLNLQLKRRDLGLHDDVCGDPPAWWLLRKKKTMYSTGGADARSVRSIMQFMMGSLNTRSTFDKDETTFRDIREYMLSMRPPKYPFPIDRDLAAKGQRIFEQTCSRCHGAYGEDWKYPNRIVKLGEIGTDPKRFYGVTQEFSEYYDKSWFAKERPGWIYDDYVAQPSNGYQAPPLDGIWATAPYFHNGSVPTIYNVLKSDSRPKRYTRSFGTDEKDYDSVKVGWKVQLVEYAASADMPPYERRKIYDTAKPGRSNAGHTYGDDLTEDERMAVIEYLKTL
jgi:hypothetical protein